MKCFQPKYRFVFLLPLFSFCFVSWPLVAQNDAVLPEAGSVPESTEPATPSQNDTVQSPFKIFGSWSFAYLGQGYPTTADTDHPDVNGIRSSSLNHLPGFGANIKLDNAVFLSPSIELLYDEYIYKTNLGMAFPTIIGMTGSDSGGPVGAVLGLLVSIPFDFLFPVSNQVTIELSPGVSFLPYIPVSVIEDKDSVGIDRIGEYLNKDLKWVYPSTAVQVSFKINSSLEAAGRLRVLYPIWHAWANDGLPFYDHMVADLSLILRILP